jgi:predicted extracellular nuclease
MRWLLGASLLLVSVAQADTPVFINEIHYDNTGTDAGEAIEIAGPAGTDLTGWSIVLYNGSDGAVYSTTALSGAIADAGGGFGFIFVDYSTNGIQNGAPDGIALVDRTSTVVQFLSYEGGFTAINGPAVGLTSDDIGVAESSGTPVGASLQLIGIGTVYEDLSWAAPAPATFGSVNSGQTFSLVETAPAVASVSPAHNATDVPRDSAILVTFTEAVSVTSDSFALDCSASGDVAFTLTGSGASYALLPDAGLPANETCALTVVAASVSDVDTDDPPDQMQADFTSRFTTEAGPMLARIHEIQGSGDAVTGSGPFTVEALVIGAYQGTDQLRGFFLQEEDAHADTDPATSEGIFVFCGTCPVSVSVGDQVRVTGPATDFFGMSQLTATAPVAVEVLSSGNPLPRPATPSLPVPGIPAGDLALAETAINAYFEPFEGMLVRFEDELTVAEYFELARYGQLVLAAGGRPRQFTDISAPGIDGYIDHLIDVASRTIILDDDNNVQNDAITGGDTPYYHPVPGLSLDNFFRGGDTITGLTGVLHWSFAGSGGTDAWRVRPVLEQFDYAFTPVNEVPAAPEIAGLKVASFNVLNYFLTIDQTSSSSSGPCGAFQNLDCRGADSERELQRQREKLTAALLELDADVVGLVELENTPGVSPLAQIVEDLNAAGPDEYAFIDTGAIGTDAIKVGIIYKTTSVRTLGDFAVLDDPAFVNPFAADADRNRPALAQTFEQPASAARFTVVVNHFKSKGSSGLDCVNGSNAVPDCDQGDGQGYFNATRTVAAQVLADWLAGDPTGSGDPNVLILGDLNAYRYEDPITALKDAGYVDLIDTNLGPDAYSYLFDGQLGYLDYALASPSLAPRVVGVAEWHINADEVPLFDYNDEILDSPGEASFQRESAALPIYAADPYRTSDHDPVIVGLDLVPPALDVAVTPDVLWPPNHKYVEVKATPTVIDAGGTVALTLISVTSNEPDDGRGDGNTQNDIRIIDDTTFLLRAERSSVGTGRVYMISYMAEDAAGNTTLQSATVSVPLNQGKRR